MGDDGQVRRLLPQAPARCLLGPPLPPPPPPRTLRLSASAPPPTLRHLRSLTSKTALLPAPNPRQGGTGAIKELPGEVWGTTRTICRDVRAPLRRPPLVTHGAAPLLLLLPDVADVPAPVTRNASSKASGAPTASGCPCRGAELAGDQQGSNREAGDRPPERDRGGTRWCRPRLGGAPTDADDR